MTSTAKSCEQPLHSREKQLSSPLFQCLAQQTYMVGNVRVFGWLLEGSLLQGTAYTPQSEEKFTHTVGLYSLQNGFVCLDFKSLPQAHEAFSLLTRYEVSPYHAEDVLEDREIFARIRYL